jgi:hypothetical protein
VQSPTPTKETVFPEIVQTKVVVTPKETGSPLVADPETTYVAPPTAGEDGELSMEIVWSWRLAAKTRMGPDEG